MSRKNKLQYDHYLAQVAIIPNPGSRIGLTPDTRRITIGQLAVLLVNLYLTTLDPDVGYLDAELSFNEFIEKKLVKNIYMDKRDLERLLWAAHTAELGGYRFAPDGKNLKDFISHLINNKEEEFDYKWNFIRSKKK